MKRHVALFLTVAFGFAYARLDRCLSALARLIKLWVLESDSLPAGLVSPDTLQLTSLEERSDAVCGGNKKVNRQSTTGS